MAKPAKKKLIPAAKGAVKAVTGTVKRGTGKTEPAKQPARIKR